MIKKKENRGALFFDFDGVIVDSVNIKAKAFTDLWSFANKEEKTYIEKYHNLHGGVSRTVKIKHFLTELFFIPPTENNMKKYETKFSKLVKNSVINCDYIPGVIDFIEANESLPKYVISGTPQDELTEILEKRDLTKYFNGILGTPIKKEAHLSGLISKYKYNPENCLFFGDAMTDYNAAKACNVQCVLINSTLDLDILKFNDFTELTTPPLS